MSQRKTLLWRRLIRYGLGLPAMLVTGIGSYGILHGLMIDSVCRDLSDMAAYQECHYASSTSAESWTVIVVGVLVASGLVFGLLWYLSAQVGRSAVPPRRYTGVRDPQLPLNDETGVFVELPKRHRPRKRGPGNNNQ